MKRIGCALVLWIFASSPAGASEFAVNSTVDAGDANLADGICDDGTGFCTLRAAIEQSNADGQSDVVLVGEATYYLTEGPLEIRSPMWLRGVGAESSVIDGNGASSVLLVEPVPATAIVRISDLTLQDACFSATILSLILPPCR